MSISLIKLQATRELEVHQPSPSHDVLKHGFASDAGFRDDEYRRVGTNGEMRIRIDGQKLSVKADAGLCEWYDFFIKAANDNLRIPFWIKRAKCIMLRERGGERFGAKKKLIFLLLEIAMQLNAQCLVNVCSGTTTSSLV